MLRLQLFSVTGLSLPPQGPFASKVAEAASLAKAAVPRLNLSGLRKCCAHPEQTTSPVGIGAHMQKPAVGLRGKAKYDQVNHAGQRYAWVPKETTATASRQPSITSAHMVALGDELDRMQIDLRKSKDLSMLRKSSGSLTLRRVDSKNLPYAAIRDAVKAEAESSQERPAWIGTGRAERPDPQTTKWPRNRNL
eukprot:scaffold225922_cov40-Prasinocladus_malaysianus.AAC.2